MSDFPELTAKKGARGTVVDLDTGLAVPRTIGFEAGHRCVPDGSGNLLVTGVLQFYDTDVFGKIRRTSEGLLKKLRARGRFKFIPQKQTPQSILLGADRCAKCQSPLTLEGDDLCPRCKALDAGRDVWSRMEQVTSPLLDHRCENKYCNSLAEVMVSDEVIVSPVLSKVRLDPHRTHSRTHSLHYERGMTVARRWYCRRHAQPPRILDARGEVVERLDPVK